MSAHNLAHAPKRRSIRIDHAVPLTVQGADVYRVPYLDHVSTMTINCHGCRYQSKYDVLPGDRVFLELTPPDGGQTSSTFRGRVKWTKRLTMKERPYEIAVELDSAGNIWGVAFPPEDWFPLQQAETNEPANKVKEVKEQPVVREATQHVELYSNQAAAPITRIEKIETTPSLNPLLTQLVAGLGEQIQVMAREAAANAIVKQKEEILAEFRAVLKSEATETLEKVVTNLKEELMRGALNSLKEAHEANARATHDRWIKKTQHDLAIASEGLMAQGAEMSHRIEGMAAASIERMQRNMEALRRDAADQFVARLREQVAPLLELAESTLQKLAACEDELQENSDSTCKQFVDFLRDATQQSATGVQAKIRDFEKQFEASAGDRLTQAHAELDKRCAAVAAESVEMVRKLCQDCTVTAQRHLQSLAAPTVDHVAQVLKERAAEIARQCAHELEENTRRYFESVSELIAEIPKKAALLPGK